MRPKKDPHPHLTLITERIKALKEAIQQGSNKLEMMEGEDWFLRDTVSGQKLQLAHLEREKQEYLKKHAK